MKSGGGCVQRRPWAQGWKQAEEGAVLDYVRRRGCDENKIYRRTRPDPTISREAEKQGGRKMCAFR